MIHLVRHAHAGRRGSHHPDGDRPLTTTGRAQADALADRLAGRRIQRIHTSPLTRCAQTVQPLSDRIDLEAVVEDALAEGAPTASTVALLTSIDDEAVLCTHRDVIERVTEALAAAGAPLDPTVSVDRAGTWELEVVGGAVVAARYVPPPA